MVIVTCSDKENIRECINQQKINKNPSCTYRREEKTFLTALTVAHLAMNGFYVIKKLFIHSVFKYVDRCFLGFRKRNSFC